MLDARVGAVVHSLRGRFLQQIRPIHGLPRGKNERGGVVEDTGTRRQRSRAAEQSSKIAIGRDTSKEFVQLEDGSYMFTRTACFMITALADRKKPQVERALIHFVSVDEIVEAHFRADPDGIDRIALREDLTDGMKSLSKTAKVHGVIKFDRFMDTGYRGMYNMPLAQLTEYKGLTRSPIVRRCGIHEGMERFRRNLISGRGHLRWPEQKTSDNIRGQHAGRHRILD